MGGVTIKEIVRNLWRLSLQFSSKYVPQRRSSILDEEWDWLIIIDACRYDDFIASGNHLHFSSSNIRNHWSNASCTLEWMLKNFSEKNDVIYFSANPKVSKTVFEKYMNFSPFEMIIPIWKYEWDKQLNTVLPSSVNEVVMDHIDDFRYNRKIVHYIQPHHPFLALPILDKMDEDNIEYGNVLTKLRRYITTYDCGVWKLLREHTITKEAARDAYRKNIGIVMKHVNQLLPHLNGKVVITSDHGNLFGEYFLYAHPYGIPFKKLREVPWIEVEV